MIKVGLPNVVETFHRAFHEVVSPFLSTGNPQMIMGLMVYFYKAELFYSLDYLDPKGDKLGSPFIVFAGNRPGTYKTEKCLDPRQPTRSFAYEKRQQVFKTVYVGFPRTMVAVPPPYSDQGAKRKVSMQDTEQLWSQLSLVLDHQHKNFNDRGIFNPRLPAVPAQTQNLDYFMVQGEMQVETRYTFTRNNTFSGEGAG